MEPFILSAFADEAASDIESQVAALQRNGIPYIEIRNVNGQSIVDFESDELRQIYNYLSSHHIRVSAIASPIGKISIGDDDMDAHFKRFYKAMDAAEILETQNIRMFSFYNSHGKTPASYQAEVITLLSKMVAIAEQRNLFLCHENEKEIFGEQPEKVELLFSQIKSDHFKGIFDFANYIQAGANPMEAYAKTKDDILYFHIKDAEMSTKHIVPAGFGDGQIRDILKDAVGSPVISKPFFLTLEPHLTVFDGYGNLGDSTALGTEKFRYKDSSESFDSACNALKRLIESIL